jgi:transcriptional regulator with XRE-family HTH domain
VNSVADRVRYLRRSRGWTQQQLADRASISLEGVWTIENGRKLPRASTLELLAGALGVEPADLVPPGWCRPRRTRRRSLAAAA